jgi:hypothetical protein
MVPDTLVLASLAWIGLRIRGRSLSAPAVPYRDVLA